MLVSCSKTEIPNMKYEIIYYKNNHNLKSFKYIERITITKNTKIFLLSQCQYLLQQPSY